MSNYKVNINGVWTDVCDCKYKVYDSTSFRQIVEGDKFWNGSSWETIICPAGQFYSILSLVATDVVTSIQYEVTIEEGGNPKFGPTYNLTSPNDSENNLLDLPSRRAVITRVKKISNGGVSEFPVSIRYIQNFTEVNKINIFAGQTVDRGYEFINIVNTSTGDFPRLDIEIEEASKFGQV